MTDLYHSLKILFGKRKSVRDFADKPVSPEDIEKIKQIAYTSPYASGRKNWDVIVIDDKATIQKVAEVVRSWADTLKDKLREDLIEHYITYSENFTIFERAPVLFIPTFRTAPGLSYLVKKPDNALLQWERDGYVKSISCVAMLILLAAESLDLGACYMTGPLIAEKKIKKIIPIKKGRDIGAIIPVGYPKEVNNGNTRN
jgi:nitroreductase